MSTVLLLELSQSNKNCKLYANLSFLSYDFLTMTGAGGMISTIIFFETTTIHSYVLEVLRSVSTFARF